MEKEIAEIVTRVMAEIAPKILQDTIHKRLDKIFEKNLLEAFSSLYDKILDLNRLLEKIPGIKDGKLEIDTRELSSLKLDIVDASRNAKVLFDHVPKLIQDSYHACFKLTNAQNALKEALSGEQLEKRLQNIDQSTQELKYIGNRLKSIDFSIQMIKDEGVKRQISVCIDSKNIPLSIEKENEEKEVLPEDQIIKCLTDREKKVFVRRLGVNGKPPMTLKEIGAELKISQERVRQIHHKCLRKIRNKCQKIIPKLTNKIILNELGY